VLYVFDVYMYLFLYFLYILCKANQIKLSRSIDGKRVVYKKSELITKLKRKKIKIP